MFHFWVRNSKKLFFLSFFLPRHHLSSKSFIIYRNQLYVSFLFCRAVPVVRPGPGGFSLSFHWRVEPSSPSWPWHPSRTASLPSAGSSSSSRAKGRGDYPAARGDRPEPLGVLCSSAVHSLICSVIHLLIWSLIEWSIHSFIRVHFSFTGPYLHQFVLSDAHEFLPV